jgi:ABC-type antimicrobial peptide transport system permease subunit
MVNLVTIIICLAALLIPARSISKIDPIKSIRFD